MVDDFFNIDENDLDAMRNQINTLYPNASSSRKAILLSNQLWQRIMPYFEIYDDKLRETLTLDLFQRTLVSNKPITADEIITIYHHYAPEPYIEEIPEADTIKPINSDSTTISHGFLRYFSMLTLLFLCVASMIGIALLYTPVIQTPKESPISFKHFSLLSKLMTPPVTIHEVPLLEVNPFAYTPLDSDKVYEILSTYNSELLNGSYIEELDAIAKEENLNPALLLSIIGQEQGFIPQNHPYKTKIINNPYNLFGSWEKHQSTFADSTRITCRFINRLLLDCPPEINPIEWINRTYAEDDRWYVGVEFFYKTLSK